MTQKRFLALLLSIFILTGIFPTGVSAADSEKTQRMVYLHAQGENPQSTPNRSTVYMGEDADIYFAVDNPNKGDYDKASGTHLEPEYDLNGYTLCICFDPEYLDFAGAHNDAPITYAISELNLDSFNKDDVNIDDVVQSDPGYFIYRHGSGTYTMGRKTYKTAYITVFYSGGYVPQKKDEQLWYNLAKLSLVPQKTGSTTVFLDIDNAIVDQNNESCNLELFAKNESDELSDQTFDFSAENGGQHHIVIKDKTRPAPPVATPGSGSYIEQVNITLTAEEDCVIYYTTDGSDPSVPSTSRQRYTGPFDKNISGEIRTCAYRASDQKYSQVVSYTYEILPDRPYLFDQNEKLLPDIYSAYSAFVVKVSDKVQYDDELTPGNEIYYTFSNADAKAPVIGTNPDAEWVWVSPQTPISIQKNCIIRLITKKMGVYSEPATYYLSIKPDAPVASHADGEYPGKIDVTLSTKTQGATIFYTLDGTDPKTSTTKIEYTGTPITIAKDTTLRAVCFYDGEWSSKSSNYYLFSKRDDFGVDAFYPSGVYEGSVNVTLTPNNPDCEVWYHTGDGKWKPYKDTLNVDTDTTIFAKSVLLNPDGTVKEEGEPYTFTYKIRPLPPEFAPESTQFTNTNKITIYTPESTDKTTQKYDLYYTLDGSDPISSQTRKKADDASDSAVITIDTYTVVTAVVLKNGETYSTVVRHSYDIVKTKPVKPLTTLLPGYYTAEIGGESYFTQFMPVPQGTEIYYTVCYNGGLCPDPVPNTEGTYLYKKGDKLPVCGNTVIKAVAVDPFGAKSDVGIFSYVVTPEAPEAAPSAVINSSRLPVVPVDAVKGSTVGYTVGGFTNQFENKEEERFYIDTQTGNAYRDKECTEPLGVQNTTPNTDDSATLEIWASLDGVTSDTNRYIYSVSDDAKVLAPPYADKKTGIYEEIDMDGQNHLLSIRLYSLNSGGVIQYRKDNDGIWQNYAEGDDLFCSEDTILQLRYCKNGSYSDVVSYVYNFVPLAPMITLPSGTYVKNDNNVTTISKDPKAPTNKSYRIWYRRNGDTEDVPYNGADIDIEHTMSVKAYMVNEQTKRVSKNTIHYYIIESGDGAHGSVYMESPYYDGARISAHLLDTRDYADGIKLLTQHKTAEIKYYYSYEKETGDGTVVQSVTTSTMTYANSPIMPTKIMDNITIYAWLEENGSKISGSDKTFKIDFVHLGIPATSLEGSGKIEFPKDTKYSLLNAHEKDKNVILYYTLDGSDPTNEKNPNRFVYQGEMLTLTQATTVKAVYFSACGKCKDVTGPAQCHEGVYGEVGTYQYTVPTTVSVGGGGGGGSTTIDKTRKYTKDIFGHEHPTHIGYINGYPDGSVNPEGDITREEMTAILYRIKNHDYEEPFVATGDAFPDVEIGRWSAHDIEYMVDKKVIYGYPNGEFMPKKSLTRAEFATLIFRFTGIEKTDIDNPFLDVLESHWAYDEILALADSGLMEGYPDKTFKPESNISRAEVMTVINKLLGRKPLESYIKSLNFNPYNDLYGEKWYYVTVLEATITHNYWLDSASYEYKWEDWK